LIFQNTIAIDIRNDRFNIVILKSSLKSTRVVSHATFPFEDDLTPAQQVKAIGDVSGELIRKNRIADPDIYLSIPRERVMVRNIRLPLAVKENLRTTLGYEMQKYVPLPANEIYFDYLPVEENRQDNTIRLLLFVIKKKDLDDYLALSDHLGCALSNVQIPATAISGFLRAHPPDDAEDQIGIIRSGEKTGEISIYRNKALVETKPVQASGDGSLVDSISDALAAIGQKQALSAAPITWYVLDESKNGSVFDRLNQKPPPGIALLNAASTPIKKADLICAYGLAMQGARDLPSRVNLLPEGLRRKPSRLGYYLLIVLVVLTLVAGASWGTSSLVRRHMDMSRLDSELASLKVQMAEVEQLAEKANAMGRQIENINRLAQKRVPALAVLENLSVRIPTDAWIQDLRLKTSEIQITGYSDSASELLGILEDSPLLKDVFFISAITRKPDGKEQFRIGMTIQQDGMK